MRDTVFLPERFRPVVSRRRPRRRLLIPALLPLVLVLLPLWRLQAVEIEGCPELPPAAVTSVTELVGSAVFTVDLGWVRRQVEVWPCVVGVAVRLELPGTLRITVDQAVSGGSIPVGTRWHGLSRDGRLSGPRDAPLLPVLHGFPRLAKELRKGLAVAERLERQSGGTVQWVRRITPSDLEVRVVAGGAEQRASTVHVTAESTAAEQLWCERLAAGDPAAAWSDLRWHDRMVISSEGEM